MLVGVGATFGIRGVCSWCVASMGGRNRNHNQCHHHLLSWPFLVVYVPNLLKKCVFTENVPVVLEQHHGLE